MLSKICCKCKKKKTLDLFHNEKRGRFGKTTRCKECRAEDRLVNKQNIEMPYYNRIENKLQRNSSRRIRGSIKCTDKEAMDLLGCSPKFFKKHLEDSYNGELNWDDYGFGGIVMDHIIPISFFNLEDETERKICFHYTNIQMLGALENSIKYNKINWGCRMIQPIKNSVNDIDQLVMEI